MRNLVIACSKNWFIKNASSEEFSKLPITYISVKENLNLKFLKAINPKYIFFPHWSWKVDKSIYQEYECVAFHTAPLPYGRGGSPIQNLIIRGFKKSPICALRMNQDIDSGPIYTKREICLDGDLRDIFKRMAEKIEEMIINICFEEPIPKNQEGKVELFSRLNYSDNEIKPSMSKKEIYDRIRMVDADDYQKAFIKFGSSRIILSKASLKNNELNAEMKLFDN
jgi:methionyl-tRNA formyltransferase